MQNVKLVDPIGLAMRGIIDSEQGQAAMLASVGQGRPALEGVDPMLREALGANYSKDNEATSQAGYLVTLRMGKLGYEKTREVALTAGCTAQSGLLFEKV